MITAQLPPTTHPTIRAAGKPQPGFQPERLLVIDPVTRRFGDFRISELPGLLGPGDVLVVNDAATLPASLRVDTELELRLLSRELDGSFRAVAFGAGDFRQPTELRGAPRALRQGETLRFGAGLTATVTEVDAAAPRLVRLRFDADGAVLFRALYEY